MLLRGGFINRKTIRNTATLLQNVWKDGKGRDKPKDWRTDDERIRATARFYVSKLHSS